LITGGEKLKQLHLLFLFLIAFFSLAVAGQEIKQETKFPEWQPPLARPQPKLFFAPKPFNHNNIFKGEAEGWMAATIYKSIGKDIQLYEDQQISDYINKLGNYLVKFSATPTRKFQFLVTDSSDADAYTAGGGRIYVCKGLLDAVINEDELASILGHEIGHDSFSHCGKTLTRQLFWVKGITKINSAADAERSIEGLYEKLNRIPLSDIAERLAGFSKIHEIEADRAGFYIAYRAGYNPRVMSDYYVRLEKYYKESYGKEYSIILNLFLGSHPLMSQRKFGFNWESNLVDLPKKNVQTNSPVFTAMKSQLK
jgi:beta-barrel assembly-enhancing protease